MIVDLNTVEGDPFAGKKYDVCIFGAGVAGITLAIKLSRKLNVLLLEGGGFQPSLESQSLYEGNSTGRFYPALSSGRLRFLGGTSNHWEGSCRILDSYDYEPKSYIPYSGWPIRQRDLNPWLKKAESVLEIPGNDDWGETDGFLEGRFAKSSNFRSVRFKDSPPTRFGQRFRQTLSQQPNITCFLNANVSDLRFAQDPSRIGHAVVRSHSAKRFEVQAGHFVLAMGGIENARLLLNSDHDQPSGLGNQKDLVGRFFTEHFYQKVADFIFEDSVNLGFEEKPFGETFKARLKYEICRSPRTLDAITAIRRKRPDCLSTNWRWFSPMQEVIERERILNFALRLQIRTPGHGQDSDGVVFIASEQSPNPSSRITVGDDVDKFGNRKVEVNWQLNEMDARTVQLGVLRFGEEFAALNLGRLRIFEGLIPGPPKLTNAFGNHHMGTTRMGYSSNEGVVDANQKVFGVDNVYVAGSSVFPTGGYANPTLTIVQTTLRLADRLNRIAYS